MSQKKILFVDDEEEIGQALFATLEPWAAQEGIELLVTNAGRSALDILIQDDLSSAIVVSDINMPEMSGIDLLLAVRERYPDIIFIFLSGHQEITDLLTAIRAGVFSYIPKPFHLELLKAELKKALDFNQMREENRSYLHRLQEEMKWGSELQKKLLHVELPQSELIRYEITYRPFQETGCGGDFYDVWDLGSDKHLVLIGDVSGHGLRSAFITILLKSLIRRYIRNLRGECSSTAGFLSWLNEQVWLEFQQSPDILVTFAACLLDLKNLRMLYSNAGHPPLYLLRGDVQRIHLPGTSMGFDRLIDYQQQEYSLRAGDLLILYTDGIIEIPRTDHLRGSRIFEDAILAARGLQPVNPSILEQVQFGSMGFADDVTLITIGIR